MLSAVARTRARHLAPSQDYLITDEIKAPSLRRLARHVLGERLFDWLQVILRVRRDYARMHGRPPALFWPQRFTEKMQWRKLFELEPEFAVLSDKIASRDFVAARIGDGYSAPLLWVGSDPAEIPYDTLTTPYVIKSNHGCGHTVIVTDAGSHDGDGFCDVARGWLDVCYGTQRSEPGYVHVPRRILVERLLLGQDGARPIEHRIFVFSGKVHVIQTTLVTEDGAARNVGFFDRNWVPLGWRLKSALYEHPVRPATRQDELIAIAERLGAGISHVRVDFYQYDDEIKVGELTLYSWSGIVPFHPDSADFELGRYWRIQRPALKALRKIALRKHELRPPKKMDSKQI